MQFRKTPTSERGHYEYFTYVQDRKGKWRKKTINDLHPGDVVRNDDGSEVKITEEMIDGLHKDDDRIVYNNNKNVKPTLSKKEKETLEQWKKELREKWEKEHPGEEYPGEEIPKNYHASLDFVYGADESDFDTEQSRIASAVAIFPNMDFRLMVEEGLNALDKEEREVFITICFEQRNGCELVEELGLSEPTISRRLKSAKETMKEYLPETL
ncbi:MAG: hypothetical protein LIO94_10830 [Clostridiales bacterium]|nr:hypothetical protein [Clostridiales bacterium]